MQKTKESTFKKWENRNKQFKKYPPAFLLVVIIRQPVLFKELQQFVSYEQLKFHFLFTLTSLFLLLIHAFQRETPDNGECTDVELKYFVSHVGGESTCGIKTERKSKS